MATHDYVIDNQTAPNFRADLNSALQAIVTQNSNATAPSVTYANMIWYDTANNQLKKRNEANSGWITLGTIDETGGTFTPNMPPISTDSIILLGTLNTTSGSTQTLSGLDLTSYKSVVAVFNGVGDNTTTNRDVRFEGAKVAETSTTAAARCYGIVRLDLASGIGVANVMEQTPTSLPQSIFSDESRILRLSTNTSSTSLSVSLSGGTFAAGSVSFYGEK